MKTGATRALKAQVVVVGAGPAGSAAAAWAARAGNDVLVIDSASFPRDKACGDGLTPRAVAELERLGLRGWLDTRIRHRGLRMSGFGGEVKVDWPGPSFPSTGSAVARFELDDRIRKVAEDSGARMLLGTKAVATQHDSSGRVTSVILADGTEVSCRQLIVADGARSSLGRKLGRRWHQETVYGVAARGYLTTARADDPWLTSHLELRSPDGAVLPGYGWIFPLGNGEVNIGVGALSTSKRPADLALRPLIDYYTDLRRDEWGFTGKPRAVGRGAAGLPRPVAGVAVAAAAALWPRLLGGAQAGSAADVPAVSAVDRTDRHALDDADDHRRAGHGQSGHRRRRGLGGARLAGRRAAVSVARPPNALQLTGCRASPLVGGL